MNKIINKQKIILFFFILLNILLSITIIYFLLFYKTQKNSVSFENSNFEIKLTEKEIMFNNDIFMTINWDNNLNEACKQNKCFVNTMIYDELSAEFKINGSVIQLSSKNNENIIQNDDENDNSMTIVLLNEILSNTSIKTTSDLKSKIRVDIFYSENERYTIYSEEFNLR